MSNLARTSSLLVPFVASALVEKRKKRALVYCSREYFDFILI
jgi:hypothetical protein